MPVAAFIGAIAFAATLGCALGFALGRRRSSLIARVLH
jgi:hypothetical protein